MTTMIFTSIYYYNSQEFIVLLLSQPIARSEVFKGIYFGVSVTFIAAYCFGLCLPLMIFYPAIESFFLVGGGIFLNLIFIALALFISVSSTDKVRGLGFVLLLWALFGFLYDGLLLFLMYQFADYPVEKAILTLTFFNPVDIVRIMIILKTEASALLGLSGAVFQRFFTSTQGMALSVVVLMLWVLIPYFLSRRIFIKKDI
jgi:Cu-processing system permease protein